jgi:regulator of sigma E protease
MPVEVARRAYYAQAPWKRIAVILAGPGVNLAIAFVLFWAVLLSGSLDGTVTLTNLNPHLKRLAATTQVGAVERGSPASDALRVDDEIVAVDGRAAGVESTRRAIDAHRCAGPLVDGCRGASPVALTVRRAGRLVHLRVLPRYSAANGRMLLGFAFGVRTLPVGALKAAGDSLATMWVTTEETIAGLGEALTSSKKRHEVSSIVGITQVTEQAVATGAGRALAVVGFVSLVLAVVNLFPFLPLDGGHVLWALAEKLRGRRVSVAAMWRFSSIGIVLMLFLVLNGFSNDIHRLTS